MKILFFRLQWLIRRVNRKVRRKLHLKIKSTKKCYGRKFTSLEETQRTIFQLVQGDAPFLIGRLGGIEALTYDESLRVKKNPDRQFSKRITEKVCINAGFINPTREKLLEFSGLLENCLKECDVLGSVITNPEDYLIRSFLQKKCTITDIGNLEPYYSTNPWSEALKGKKVLVVSPFAESIQRQYQRHSMLFQNPKVLPDFELKTLKAVQTIAGTKSEFDDWFEALDYMFQEAMKLDFDVAIIGCGAYGFPLAYQLKMAGKQAIHLGGATQILFGVWGKRWDSVEEIRKLKNDYWVRPSDQERPANLSKVENGCYW